MSKYRVYQVKYNKRVVKFDTKTFLCTGQTVDPIFEASHHLAFFLLENGSFAPISQRYTVEDILKGATQAKAKENAVFLLEWFENRLFRKTLIELFIRASSKSINPALHIPRQLTSETSDHQTVPKKRKNIALWQVLPFRSVDTVFVAVQPCHV